MTLNTASPLISVGVFVAICVVWVGPIGLFVLRKQLAGARGARLVLKAVLTTLTVLTAPAAALMALMVVFSVGEAVDLFWSLLKNAW